MLVVRVLENPDRFAIRLTEQISLQDIGLIAVTESVAAGVVSKTADRGPGVEKQAGQHRAGIRRHPCPCWEECAAARAWGYLFCFLRGEELPSLNSAFNFETSSRSAAISFWTAADPGSSFDSLAGAGADGRGAERGIQGGRRLAAAGRTEVK